MMVAQPRLMSLWLLSRPIAATGVSRPVASRPFARPPTERSPSAICRQASISSARSDVDQGDWLRPGFLDAVATAAVKVTIAEGGKTVQDLMIGAGR